MLLNLQFFSASIVCCLPYRTTSEELPETETLLVRWSFQITSQMLQVVQL